MADGDWFNDVVHVLLENGYSLRDPARFEHDFENSGESVVGHVYTKGDTNALLSHADFLGEFTDLQFAKVASPPTELVLVAGSRGEG